MTAPPQAAASAAADAAVELECKKLCVRRCFYAVLYSVAAQFALLATFLLFVHFSPLRPLDWLSGTVAAFVAWRTWLGLVPLLGAVIVHGLLLGKTQLTPRTYHAHRFAAIRRTGARRAALLAVHVAIGLLTAWLYARHLPPAYAHLYAVCEANAERYCLNERYALLLLAGTYTAMYQFVRERVHKPLVFVVWPLVHQARYLEMRTNVHEILGAALRAAVVPIGAFAVAGCVLGDVFVSNVAQIFGLARDGEGTADGSATDGGPSSAAGLFLDPWLVLFMWVIAVQIIGNMRLTDHLFNTFLTEPMQFAVERPPQPAGPATATDTAVTLVEALGSAKTPIVQHLAALNLVQLCQPTAGAAQRRQQVYALSVPGGHPYNWNALCAQCLTLIEAFRTELQIGVEQALRSTTDRMRTGAYLNGPAAFLLNKTAANGRPMSAAGESASEMAAKLMMRQYNETFGIRNMSSTNEQPEPAAAAEQPACRRAQLQQWCNEMVQQVTLKLQQIKIAFLRLPGTVFCCAQFFACSSCWMLC